MNQDLEFNIAIVKYFSGEAETEEKILIREWLSESEMNRKEFDQLRLYFSEDQSFIDKNLVQDRYKQFVARLSNSENQDNQVFFNGRLQLSRRWSYGIAASVTFFLALITLIGFFLNHPDDNAIAAQDTDTILNSETKYGQKMHLQLPDGSEVWLNSGSKISFPKYFSNTVREVTIYGEGFFNVTHDPSRPFIVKSPDLSAEVLGTSFNIRAYEDETEQKVSLVTGKVKVVMEKRGFGAKDEQSGYFLFPGSELVYEGSIGKITEQSFDIQDEIAWKDGVLIFSEDDFRSLTTKIERWYGVNVISTGNPPKDFVVTGSFKNETLHNVLEVLKYGRGFDFKIDTNSLYINFNS
jgi:ferric-dicitrate binding protein FerR (iron transport regulator)